MYSKLLVFIITIGCSMALHANVLVIVNTKNPLVQLEHKQLVDLFMGRVSAFPNNYPAQPLDLSAGMPLRASFYKLLTGKSEAQVDAYWATLVFAGRMSPPVQYRDDKALIIAVANNPAAIAYVQKQALPPTVKVIMELAITQ